MDYDVTVALSPHAPGQVRHSLAKKYMRSMEPSLLDDVILAASEIVSNAVLHSGRPEGDPITVHTTVNDGVLRLEVTDKGDGVDALEARSLKPPSGLGYVQIVSDRWSSHVRDAFHVWFEIDVTSLDILARTAP